MEQHSEKEYSPTTRQSLETETDSSHYDDSEGLVSGFPKRSKKISHLYRIYHYATHLLIAVLLIVVVVETITLNQLNSRANGCFLTSNGLSRERNMNRTIYQHSKFVSHNETEASEAWGSILAGHGVVALDPSYVEQKQLPESLIHPNGSGKVVYVLEAYHAIHCIQYLRTHFVALEQNASWDWSRPHDMHCFDALRQYVMCNIDDTLLKTTGHRDAGHGQSKMCHDWDALRDWAEERSASYFDIEPGLGRNQIDNYHAGDGLPVGSLS